MEEPEDVFDVGERSLDGETSCYQMIARFILFFPKVISWLSGSSGFICSPGNNFMCRERLEDDLASASTSGRVPIPSCHGS